ncbi:Protein C, Serine peptidase, MEROPS family S49 [Cereibacter sphaeroides WS8N]|uniref:S49 family peptidase n=1 Tax=Cereibacter sphaeroides TaxID=1063 RepID=UPI00020B00CA|nr:S49 family peptidase [Cereibacter sphaeroides]EGJ19648.1 Protein C, Serine peptidase, MEROPS family S49 [Cereibacter sphaeroides WS8N]
MNYPMIAGRVFGTPLLVDPVKGAAFLAGLGPRLVNGALELRGLEELAPDRVAEAGRIAPRASVLLDDVGDARREAGRPLYRVEGGVAVIEVTGTLVHRGGWIGQSSGTTSYEGLMAQITAAVADPSVHGIALEIDSYGGEVAGLFDLADAIRAARAVKPVRAFVAEAALSAAYAIASQAERIVLPRTGAVGSIGVLLVHADFSQAMADRGVAVTLIHAGRHKVDGNPYEALPEGVRADLQARVEASRGLFAETVAAGRGARLSRQQALATEAQVLDGAAAVAAGLADEVSDLRSAFAAFRADLSSPHLTSPRAGKPAAAKETQTMTDETTTGAAQGTAAEGGAPPLEAAEGSGGAAPVANVAVAEAAELIEIGQQAARLGLTVDVADAMRRGLSAAALRRTVLDGLAARGDGADLVAHAPTAAAGPKESPLLAAARRTAEAQAASRRA